MRILHICNGYTSSRLYDELFSRLAYRGIKQTVIAPSLPSNDLGVMSKTYEVHRIQRNSSILYRLLFLRKIKRIYRYIICNTDCKFDVIHAHTLFSDGFVAYKMHRNLGIPYIIAVRNTDIDVFYKYYIHLRKTSYKILLNASAIIFISSTTKQKIKQFIPHKIYSEIENKIKIIPNGINNLWFKRRHIHHEIHYPLRLIYCGQIIKRKNIESIIAAANMAVDKGIDVSLAIIGKKDGQNDTYFKKIEMLSKNSDCKINIYGRKNIVELIELYRSYDIFITPSHHETFGLVYVEALSQGLPVIY